MTSSVIGNVPAMTFALTPPPALAGIFVATPQEWLLALFALSSFVLLGLWVIARARIKAAIFEKTRAEFSQQLVERFERGMETRIGAGGHTPSGDSAPDDRDGLGKILVYSNIAEALSGGYECVYYIDMRTRHFDQYRARGLIENLRVDNAGEDFFGLTQRLLPSTIHHEDLPAMQAAFTREAMDRATADGKIFTITYRIRDTRGGGDGYTWFNARAVRATSGDNYHLVVAISDVDEQMRREKGHEARADAYVAKLEDMLHKSGLFRKTLTKLAILPDKGALPEVALQETGAALGAVAAYLFRHEADGGATLVRKWCRSPDRDVLPDDIAETARSAEYLGAHSEIRYIAGQAQENNPRWDDMLGRIGANRFLAGPVMVGDRVWGHVSYLIDREGEPGREELAYFREACTVVRIGVRRMEDLIARDQYQRDLLSAAEAANQAARAKTMFLATMSHEIRTPLNAVIGFSEFLNRPGLTPEAIKDYTTGISLSANALLTLINDILDLSKLDAGKVDMHGHCNLARLFAEMKALFQYTAESKGVRTEFSISEDIPVLNLAEERMRQILLNLIGNAVKFTNAGEVEWRAIAAPAGPDAVSLEITVRDPGIGVSRDKLETIFDPFAQDGATRGGKVYSGTGLGLPIVRRLVEAMNGTIRMESEPGKGSCVRIRIDNVPIVRDAPQKWTESAPSPSSDKLAIPPDFRALIVDDVPINLKILDLHVKKLGITDIAQASSGTEALKLIGEKRPDVILTDMWMPGMSGEELAKAVRKDKSLYVVPLVAVPADKDMKATFDASLFACVVTKPVTADKLREALASLFPSGS